MVIAATGDDDGASMAGAAYIFRWNGVAWCQEAKLTASDPAERDFFGHSVAISAEVALIGLSQDDDADTASGSAYVFRFDGSDWLEEVKLTAPEPVYYGGFGASVSMSGDTLLIGAHSPDPATGPGYGSAYVYRFRRARWVLEAELTASRSPPPGLFGRAVSIDGNLALIGASGDDAAGLNSGSAYLFRFDGANWNEVAQVTASDAARMDEFGFGVSIDGGIAVVGAPYHGHPTRANGAAYVLAVNGRDCNANEQLDVCDILEGTSNDVDANAIPDECEPFVTIDVKPRSCPNLLNPKSRGKLPVAIVAAAWFDVTEIDIGSLVLSRSDGVGGAVTPFRGPAGASVRILDVAAPFRGEFCGCNHLTGDRIDDLVLKFSTLELVEAFDLNTTGSRTEIAVTLGGSLLDQTEFEASDCIVLPGPHAPVRSTDVKHVLRDGSPGLSRPSSAPTRNPPCVSRSATSSPF